MKKSLNLELLEFHVNEAMQELETLLDSIRQAKDSARCEDKCSNLLHWPLTEGAFSVSLEHAYHHLNFAWNGRSKLWKRQMLSLIEMKNFRVRAVLSGILSDSGRSLC